MLIKTNFAQVRAEVPPPALTEIAYQAGNHGASGDHRTGFQLSAVNSLRRGFDHAHPFMPVMVRVLGQAAPQVVEVPSYSSRSVPQMPA